VCKVSQSLAIDPFFFFVSVDTAARQDGEVERRTLLARSVLSLFSDEGSEAWTKFFRVDLPTFRELLESLMPILIDLSGHASGKTSRT